MLCIYFEVAEVHKDPRRVVCVVWVRPSHVARSKEYPQINTPLRVV